MRRSEMQASVLPSTLSDNSAANSMAKDIAPTNKKYRPRKNYLEQKTLSTLHKSDAAKSASIRSMEVELLHYRNLLEFMVKERTSMLECRLSILEHCNAQLGDNYHQMHQQYLKLLKDSENKDNLI